MKTCSLVCLVAVATVAAWAQSGVIQGVIRDPAGAVVPEALVTIRSGTFVAVSKTDQSGRFRVAGLPAGTATIRVSTPGLAAETVSVDANEVSQRFEIVLRPSATHEQVIVSAARTNMRISEAPGSAVLLSSADIQATPALTLDDLLRQIPGFTLFRRSSSRTANPTSQGVSLRGLGASGASRALVMVEGVSLLDPFGGWVYWDRVPRASIAGVEVFRGGASSLYGSNAMGGLIEVSTRTMETPTVNTEFSYGNENTPDLSIWTGTMLGRWDVQGAADLFRTDGYILVPIAFRGAIDTPANSEHGTLDFELGHSLGANGTVFVRSNLFEEFRHNGTPIQTNDTHLASGIFGVNRELGSRSQLQIRAFGTAENYNQNFSAIASDRMSESLTNVQHVPSQQTGGTVQWTHVLGSQTLIAGADLAENIGESREQIFSSGTHIANSVAGGRQRTLGIFAEDVLRIHDRWTVIAGARVDHWKNFDGSSRRTTLGSEAVKSSIFPDRTETAWDPRLSVLRSLTQKLSVTGSIYRAFRAPSLNELDRTFRVGNIVTLNNAALRAERLTGAEAGLNAYGFNRRLATRGTFFWSDVVNTIANVTLSTTPSLITRQRQNLGRIRARGLEVDAVGELSEHVQISGGYSFTDSTVVRNPADVSLQGRQVPQVPRHQFTVEAQYWNPASVMFSVQGRFVGNQFEDDRNLLPLDRYFSLDVLAARQLRHGLSAFIALENVLNQHYEVGRTPVPTLGPPIGFRVGLRFASNQYAGGDH